MKKIDTTTFREPTKKEIDKIYDKIHDKKTRFYDFGLDIGVTCILMTIVVTAIFLLCRMFLLGFHYVMMPIFLFEIGVCCIIGANRAKKELDIFESGEFKVKDGYIKEILKETCWYQKISVCTKQTEIITIKVFGKNFKKNNHVLVAYTNNPNKYKWFVPRIFKK
jgi:hypothetical protein